METRKSLNNPLRAGDEAPKRGIHPGFEPQGRLHQKFKRGVSVTPTKRADVLQFFFKKNENLQTTVPRLKTNINRFLKMIRWKTVLLQWRIQDIPEKGTNSQSGCANLLFYNFFAENCIKMKEFGTRRGRPSLAPLGSANALDSNEYSPMHRSQHCSAGFG